MLTIRHYANCTVCGIVVTSITIGVTFCDEHQSSKSGRAYRVGFGPKVDQNFGLNSSLKRTFFH